jgi:hypothetical protein
MIEAMHGQIVFVDINSESGLVKARTAGVLGLFHVNLDLGVNIT